MRYLSATLLAGSFCVLVFDSLYRPGIAAAAYVYDHECLQRRLCPDAFCPDAYGTCESDFPPNCDDPCDLECSADGSVSLICVYQPTACCATTSTVYECPAAQRKTCTQPTGYDACDCQLPYLTGSWPCPTQTICDPQGC